jgi:tetratricopeptide (TPR) repeat protein
MSQQDLSRVQSLLAQKKYRKAIEEIHKIQRSHPDLKIIPSEADVWCLRGQDELNQSDFRAAENSLRQALKLGSNRNVHYWLAKTLLGQNRLDAALDFIRKAFDDNDLPKDDVICYLKLLLMKGDRATVEELIKTKSKRFSAAQLHWVKGVLALESGDPDAALLSLLKYKTPLTPGDSVDAWLAYTYHQQQEWQAASSKLGLSMLSQNLFGPPRYYGQHPASQHPAIVKLMVWHQGIAERSWGTRLPSVISIDEQTKAIFIALGAVKLMEEDNFHDASHAILNLKRSYPQVAEVMALKSKILLMGGQQALGQDETGCVVEIWRPLLQERELNPQYAVNFSDILYEEGEHQERYQLLIRLQKWIEQDAKRNPDAWPKDYFKQTIAHLYCKIADSLVCIDRQREAFKAVQQAENLLPTFSEVIARRGMMNLAENPSKAIELLTQALNEGCQTPNVYEALVAKLIEQGDKEEALAIRKRHGKKFGDMSVESEVEIETWIEAIATRDYDLFSAILPDKSSNNPALRACQIFKEAAHGKLTGTGKTSIHQEQAIEGWNQLLETLSSPEQVKALQAIALSINILSKRDKGIAALLGTYMAKMMDLFSEIPEARRAYLIVLSVKENSAAKLQSPLKLYLDSSPQPGNALALLQLDVRWFAQTTVLQSFIETALSREPQNPLLLLAKASTYSPDSDSYEKLRESGFDLARRLQDATALQAFRVDDFYVKYREVNRVMPKLGSFDKMTPTGIEKMIEEMIRKTIGKEIPPAELERIMPMFKESLLNRMPMDDDDDDDDYEPDIFESIFGASKRKKRKRNFMDL